MNQSVFTRVGRELSRVFAQLLREIGRNLRTIYSSSPHMHGRNKDIKDADRPKCLFPRSTAENKTKSAPQLLGSQFPQNVPHVRQMHRVSFPEGDFLSRVPTDCVLRRARRPEHPLPLPRRLLFRRCSSFSSSTGSVEGGGGGEE